jgi:tetratricopeptide (TPR) repeat protein
VERACQAISKELVWKIYFEAAQIEERAGNLGLSRAAYVRSVEHCPENLLWKVWLGGSRTELNNDNIDIARKLLTRALKEVPTKMRAIVLLECSRLEEYAGNVDKARRILQKAKHEARHEWKVFLESVLLEMRANNIEGAIAEAKEALKIHSGTGRLWAVLIQLQQGKDGREEGIRAQFKVII